MILRESLGWSCLLLVTKTLDVLGLQDQHWMRSLDTGVGQTAAERNDVTLQTPGFHNAEASTMTLGLKSHTSMI
jgi:hypothetical protein